MPWGITDYLAFDGDYVVVLAGVFRPAFTPGFNLMFVVLPGDAKERVLLLMTFWHHIFVLISVRHREVSIVFDLLVNLRINNTTDAEC